jgi:phage FluMu protein Com
MELKMGCRKLPIFFVLNFPSYRVDRICAIASFPAITNLSPIFTRLKNMSDVKEIKCPHCGEWTMWSGHIDDRCLYCNGFLETREYAIHIEKKIRKEVINEDDFLFINPNDGFFKRWLKQILNFVRWGGYYIAIVFFIVVTLLIVIISFLPA